LAGGRPAQISGEPARARMHLMRAHSDAVAIGIGTALSDDPLLTCRLPGMQSPLRIVLDGTLRLPLASRLVATARATPVLVAANENAPRAREIALREQGVEVLRTSSPGERLDLLTVLKALAARGLTRVMVEGGPNLAAALLNTDLVDEAALFRAPQLLGPEGIDALAGLPLSALTHSGRLNKFEEEWLGHDRLELFERR